MSLLRTHTGALLKPALGRPVALASRKLTTEVKPPVKAEETSSSEVVPIPQKDVVTADVVSGAPG
jgi:hypothetical protein